MKRKLSWIACCLLAGAGVYLSAQEAQPSHRPTDVELEMLGVQTRALGRDVAALRASGADDALLVDVEVYHKACEWMLRYPEEYYRKIYIHDALDVAAEGRRRAAALAKGETPWLTTPGRIARGYRSQVDGSVQPYIVDVPPGYDGKPLRLDVVLHGRNSRLNEVSFLTSAARPRAGRPSRTTCSSRSTAGRTTPTAGPERRTCSRRWRRSSATTASTSTAWSCEAFRWAAPGLGRSACITLTAG
ncbi:MAG: hypothetical protein R2724_12310 [Bryobacterales bacterium]